jgi:hypothetical protein
MQRLQRDLVVAIALLVLAGLALAGSLTVVERRVLRQGEIRSLLAFLDGAALPPDRLLLTYPAEAVFPLLPGLDLAARRMVLVSQHTVTFPLYLLQGQPEIFLLRDATGPPQHLNLASLSAAPVAQNDRYGLVRVALALASWLEDFERYEVARVVGTEATAVARDGDAYPYGPKRWDSLHRARGQVDKLEYPCLAIHPEPEFAVRIASPLAPGQRLAQVHLAGLDSGDRKKDNRYALTVRVRDDGGRELQRQARTLLGSNLARWETLEIDARGGARLEVELGVNRGGRHHLCLMGDLLQ